MSTAGLTEISFPNGLRLFCLPRSQAETRFVYCEVFEDQIYGRHGITIQDGDCVLDVGANIGMFAVWLIQRFQDLRIYAFEPVTPIFAALRANLERSEFQGRASARLFDHGISDEAGTDEITFYPASPANSTLYPEDKTRDHEVKAQAISVRDVWKYDKAAFLGLMLMYPFRRQLIRWRLGQLYRSGQAFQIELKPLSTVIEEQNLTQVDLLKVDVEGSEFQVLAGIGKEHWPKIKQIVMEVSPANTPRIEELRLLLASRGFSRIALESMGRDNYVEGSRLACNVYARR